MANLSPKGVFDSLKESTKRAIRDSFPIEGNKRVLELVDVTIDDSSPKFRMDNLAEQKKARVQGTTWGVPVKGSFVLRDKDTNKVLERKTIMLLRLPKTTQRFSYIVKGHERQVDSVFRLSPGAYHGTADNGDIVAKWNMMKGRGAGGFNIKIDRQTGYMHAEMGRGASKSTKIPLYSLCKVLGATDAEMQKAWGNKILEVNKKKAKPIKNMLSLHRAYEKKNAKGKYTPPSPAEASAYAKQLFANSKINKEVSKSTLGLDTDSVNYQSLLNSGEKLIKISRQEVEEDDRQSLAVKTLHDIDDFASESIMSAQRDIVRKARNLIDKPDRDISAILGGANTFAKPVEKMFEATQLPTQTNPLQFVANHTKTTILGQAFGGIAGDNVNLSKDKQINPTHLGLLDPLQTPESADTGVILHVPLGAKKRGNKLVTRVFDLKQKKVIEVSAADMERKVVAYPDQFKKAMVKGQKTMVPLHKDVVVYDKDRSTAKRPASEVDYVLLTAKGLFSISANMIPFVQNDNGNRAMMASKHQEQAVSLYNREEPLVQAQTDSAGLSFEKVIGGMYSHPAEVSGTVTKVTEDSIHIKDAKTGKTVKQSIYNNYPLNGSKHMLNAESNVKVGDKVKQGQTVADTNFTKNGKLSLGTNLRVGYLPYKGYNFEDGVVISESAAEKLTSSHLHEDSFVQYPGMVVDLVKWRAYAGPEKATPSRIAKLGKDGVIRKGQKVVDGDVLICGLAPSSTSKEHQAMSKMFRGNLSAYRDRGVYWHHDYGGEVVEIVRAGKEIKVFIRTEQKMEIGDKLSGRHGNKGIVTKILPNHEMPKDKDGKHVQILLSPAGVPSRMNPGQLLETAASKIAKKTGKPYVIENFAPGIDYMQKIKDDLKKHGLSDTEELFDPETGDSLGQVMVGDQYILKLDHQAEKKVTARSTGLTGATGYTDTGQPTKGSGVPGGGQKVGQLDTYALLAHGARHNLREMATYKSDVEQSEVWKAVMTGSPLPAPKVPTSMLNFQGYLRGMGIDMSKKGDDYTLSPLTDKQTIGIAGGAKGKIKFPAKALYAKGAMTVEEKNGLFDTNITGGLKGKKWSYIDLEKKMPNPSFEHAIKGVLQLKDAEFEELVGGDLINGKSGFDIIEQRLSKVNVKKDIKEVEANIGKLKGSDLNKAYKRLRYLKALDKLGLSPQEAYLNKALPVIPPVLRPIKIGFDGKQIVDDFNYLYLNIGQMNEQLRTMDKATPEKEKQKQYADMYDAVRALKMNGMDQGSGSKARHYTGLMEKMTGKGKQPKNSYFQDKVVGKRQDLSARSVIIPEPDLKLDQVGIPKTVAMELYKPFVVKEMVRNLSAEHPLEALMKIKQNDPVAVKALEKVFDERPVIMKRDPALHKFSMQAFHPKLTDGKAIKIHPLVCGGFNADFDGDQMALYVPVSDTAVNEAKEKMMPSKNLFSPTTYGIMPTPSQDAVLGLYLATKWGKKKNVMISKPEDIYPLLKRRQVKPTDVVKYMGKETTIGRLLLHDGLPKGMQPNQRLLFDKSYKMTKGKMKDMLTEVAKKHPEEYKRVADHFKMHGFNMAYSQGASMSLNDFHDGHKLRDEILQKRKFMYKGRNTTIKDEEARIRRTIKNPKKRDDAIVELYTFARGKIESIGKKAYEGKGNRMYDWALAGARGNWNQMSQMTMAPLLVTDPAKKDVPVPITKSFGEGLPISQYWASLHGARKGTIDRAQGTADPGALTKDLVNTVIDYHITINDCGTQRGALLSTGIGANAISNESEDLIGRFTAKQIKLKGGDIIPRNTLLNGGHLSRIKNSKIRQIVVRTPLQCEARKGICQKCFGNNETGKLHALGTNIGTIAGHSLGEPVTQMQMRTFHTGGVGGAGLTDYFQVAKDLFKVPKKLRGSATISTVSGAVSSIKKRTDGTGGHDVYIGTKAHYVPADREVLPNIKVGAQVKTGEALSSGRVNPHDLLNNTKSMSKVRNHITGSLMGAYAGDCRRRNVETVIRAMTNVTRIDDPGAHSDLNRGQYTSLSEIEHRNKEAKATGQALIQHTPTLKPMDKVPITVQEDFLGRLNYQRMKDTYLEGAAQQWSSNIHGHPIAGIAHGAEFGFKLPKGTQNPPQTNNPFAPPKLPGSKF